MWSDKVIFSKLISNGRWKVEFFVGKDDSILSAYEIVNLAEIVEERQESLDPQTYPNDIFNYIGLENIESLTGDLINFTPCYGRDIRSRSKIFQQDDLLYGRLRPYLNKVYYATGDVSKGICSTEFYVLRADETKILPRFLRTILASEFVLQRTVRFQSGAALPRISKKDLFSISIPLPPIEDQQQYNNYIEQMNTRRLQLKKELNELPQIMMSSIMDSLKEGYFSESYVS